MSTDPTASRGGYWWQCGHVSEHQHDFPSIAGVGIVEFLFKLAESGWNQSRLTNTCPSCREPVRVAYAFPRRTDAEVLLLQCVVGLTDEPDYLPMMWEAQASREGTTWFDFKYVRRAGGRYQAYGLARPAVFTARGLRDVLVMYAEVTGKSLLS